MNFYFQNGEFISETQALSVLKDISLLVGGALLGFGLSIIKDIITDKKRIKKTGRDFIHEIILLEEPIKKQIDSINKLIVDLKEEGFSPPYLLIEAQLNSERIKNASKSDIIDFINGYENDRKSSQKKINSLFALSDIVNHNYNELTQKFELYLDETGLALKKWKSSNDKLVEYWTNEVTNIEQKGKKLDDDNLLKSIEKLITDSKIYSKPEEVDILKLRESYHEKILNLCFLKHKLDERTRPILSYNKSCFEAINEIKAEKKYFIFHLEKIAESFDTLLKKLKEEKLESFK